MQVIALDGTESARTEDLLRQSSKLRAQVFQGRLHWDVRVSGGQEQPEGRVTVQGKVSHVGGRNRVPSTA